MTAESPTIYYVVENLFVGQLAALGPYQQIPGRRFYTIQTHVPACTSEDGFLTNTGATWSRVACTCQCPTEARQRAVELGGNVPVAIDPDCCQEAPQSACIDSIWYCSVKPTPVEMLGIGCLVVADDSGECGVVVQTYYQDSNPGILVLFESGLIRDFSAAEAYYFIRSLQARCATAARIPFTGLNDVQRRFKRCEYADSIALALCRRLVSPRRLSSPTAGVEVKH